LTSSERPTALTFLLPASCLLIYLALAFSGIHYGLPKSDRVLSYNTDETTWLEAIGRMKSENRLNPHPTLGHPTFYLGIYGAALGTAGLTGWLPIRADKEWLRKHPDQFARFYLVGRYLQILFGVLLILSFWALIRTIWGATAAGISTLLLSVTPAFIAASHFSQASLPVTALTFWSLACLLMDGHRKPDHPRWVYAGALFAGLAISTKYSAFPLVFPLFYQIWHHRPQPRKTIVTAVFLALGFFIGSPFALLTPHLFLQGFIHHAAENVEPVTPLWRKILYPWTYSFRFAMGGFLEIVCIIAGVWHVTHKKWNPTLTLWMTIFIAAVTTVGYIATPERVLIGVPALVIGAGLLLAYGIKQGGMAKNATYVLTAVLFFATLLPTLSIVQLRRQKPLQTQASEWILSEITINRPIGVPRSIYWWTPDAIHQSMTRPERMAAPYRVINLDFSVENATQARPDFIVVSDYEKLHCSYWPAYTDRCGPFFQWLESGTTYRLVKRFDRDVRWMGWRWKRPESTPSFDDDLWATSLTIYERIPA
jgi:hypothetical protein